MIIFDLDEPFDTCFVALVGSENLIIYDNTLELCIRTKGSFDAEKLFYIIILDVRR